MVKKSKLKKLLLILENIEIMINLKIRPKIMYIIALVCLIVTSGQKSQSQSLIGKSKQEVKQYVESNYKEGFGYIKGKTNKVEDWFAIINKENSVVHTYYFINDTVYLHIEQLDYWKKNTTRNAYNARFKKKADNVWIDDENDCLVKFKVDESKKYLFILSTRDPKQFSDSSLNIKKKQSYTL